MPASDHRLTRTYASTNSASKTSALLGPPPQGPPPKGPPPQEPLPRGPPPQGPQPYKDCVFKLLRKVIPCSFSIILSPPPLDVYLDLAPYF